MIATHGLKHLALSVRDPDRSLRFYAQCPGAVFIVRVTATRIFPNCPRYIHTMRLVEHSAYAPRPDYTPPVPAWKTVDAFRDYLPARDRSDDETR